MTKKVNFECKRCGECCKVPTFFKVCDEYEKAEEISVKFNIEFIEIPNGPIGPHLIPKISYDQLTKVRAGELEKAVCPFLEYNNDKANCSIYDIRPVLCKTFGNSIQLCPNQGR